MREIKLRAWDKIRKKIVMVDNIAFMPDSNDGEDINHWHDTTRHILMQYTGLKDKNRKEIYFDSDIVEYTYEESVEHEEITVVGTVVLDLRFTLSLCVAVKGGALYHFTNGDLSNIEIIGNKFENPELLEDKK